MDKITIFARSEYCRDLRLQHGMNDGQEICR